MRVTALSAWPWLAHQVSCPIHATIALFRPAFASPSGVTPLSWPHELTRWLILLKARRQGCPLRLVVSARFQVLFHSPRRGSFHLSLTVLLHYRSSGVFSLGWWSTQFPTVLACTVVLRIPRCLTMPTGLSPLWPRFPTGSASSSAVRSYNPNLQAGWFGLLRFRSPLLAESSLFLGVLRCFSSPGSLP